MLPLRRSELIISLTPQQLLISGAKEPLSLSCLPSGSNSWSAPLAVLEGLATQAPLNTHRGNVTVRLSNHFIRYMVVPWSEMLLRGDEQQSYLQHLFGETYGELAARYELRLSPASPGRDRIASAIDSELLQQLRGLLDRKPLRLVSIQPWLMHHFNPQRRHFKGEGGWFITVESGALGILGIHNGRWRVARSLRCSHQWQQELQNTLERLYLCGDGNGIPKVIHCVSHDEQPLTLSGEWRVTNHETLPPLKKGGGGGFPASADLDHQTFLNPGPF